MSNQTMVVFALALAACSDAEPDADAAAGGAQRADVAAAPVASADAATGTMVLGGTTYEFRVSRCDLTGNSPDGMLLKGAGTAPDGRRLTVEVERLARSETTQERATIYFGSIVDGDHWTASRSGHSGGRWFAGSEQLEQVDGPLLQVSGDDLLVQDTFAHETKDSSQAGVMRATCAS